MSATDERNRAVTRRLLEDLWSGGDLAVAEELFAPDLVHHMAPAGIAPGPAGQRAFLALMREKLPEMRTQINQLIVEGDLVAVRWTRTARQPNGELRRFEGADILRIVDGKIVEIWAYQPQQ